jgi:hypothetical protein
MLPVVDTDGKSTVWRILAYSGALVSVSLLPFAVGMAGRVYLIGAVMMGLALFRVSAGMAYPQLPVTAAASKARARWLLRTTILYLPLLLDSYDSQLGSLGRTPLERWQTLPFDTMRAKPEGVDRAPSIFMVVIVGYPLRSNARERSNSACLQHARQQWNYRIPEDDGHLPT